MRAREARRSSERADLHLRRPRLDARLSVPALWTNRPADQAASRSHGHDDEQESELPDPESARCSEENKKWRRTNSFRNIRISGTKWNVGRKRSRETI